MKRIIAGLKLLRSYLPKQLPQTGAQMESFLVDVMELAGVPDNDSFRQAVASELMNLRGLINKRSKQYFVKVIKQRITNQLAYNIISIINEREKAANVTVQQSQV